MRHALRFVVTITIHKFLLHHEATETDKVQLGQASHRPRPLIIPRTIAHHCVRFRTTASTYPQLRRHTPLPAPPGSSRPHGPEPAEHAFSLRHIFHHGTYKYPHLHKRKDVHPNTQVMLLAEDGYDELSIPQRLKVKSSGTRIERLKDRRPSIVDPLVAESRRNGHVGIFGPSAWTVDDIPAPNVTDKETVLNLALIASNAYVEDEDGADWEIIRDPYKHGVSFGWELDGLRGHVWADERNDTIIIGLKGTSPALFDGEGTTTNDKVNDNLFFSCCCAQQGQWSWTKVCDCATGTYSCNNTCVRQQLYDEHRYYTAGRELYSNITEMYPSANVWLVGHSLGGAVSSLLGLTYGPFGSPGAPGADPGAPQAREHTGTYHFGHTADPVYIGTCNGATSTCSFGGYAMESVCHTGYECTYDVVADKGWRVGIGTHKIRAVIHDVIMKYDTVPECVRTPECRDCANWKMYESNGTETTTRSTSTTHSKTLTRTTRTATCETPGCTSSTSTCKTPGWFGCKDKTTTTEEVTITTTRPVTTIPKETTTCLTPGRFWGCYDDDITVTDGTTTRPISSFTPTITSTSASTTEASSTTEPPPGKRVSAGLG
ncbi:unnamed protein product [Parascedosporium putredinis]|uniref:triacylglycerol lipase n=1 Tax=Parascedosporium putredinis TaxID=1442378 RepID=A0A9P1MEJ1_9PEZI|nr:unnamed protein product [Parascedosporium putredinis]CAI8000645.1 unnamed protein product [Parascedosporium putredinis]